MAGYRASLTLALPEFDTYNAIPRYARHPDDPLAAASFMLLVERARRHLVWSAHDLLMAGAPFEAVMQMRLGQFQAKDAGSKQQVTVEDMAEATDAERMDLYMKAVKAAGLDIDPAVFMNKKGAD